MHNAYPRMLFVRFGGRFHVISSIHFWKAYSESPDFFLLDLAFLYRKAVIWIHLLTHKVEFYENFFYINEIYAETALICIFYFMHLLLLFIQQVC